MGFGREVAPFPSLTQGSVVFIGPNRIPAQDNSNFFWNDATNRLGLGTNAPSSTLDVVGDVEVAGSGTGGSVNFLNAGGAPGASPLAAPINQVGVALPNYYLVEPQAWAYIEIGGVGYVVPAYQ